MYSHEALHFLSGVVGSIAGCWIYFSLQERIHDSQWMGTCGHCSRAGCPNQAMPYFVWV